MPPKRKEKEEKTIRLRSQHVFLTYAACSIPLPDILDQLSTKLKLVHNDIKKYIISHELHKDGTDHRHCWLQLYRAPEHVDPGMFHLDGPDKIHKGNYQSIKYEENCKDYVIKDGEFISNMTKEQMDSIRNSTTQKMNKTAIGKLILEGIPLNQLVITFPALLFDYNKLKANVRAFQRDTANVSNLTKLENEWVYGGTGAGKSKYVHETYPTKCKKTKDIYWNNYCGEDVVYLEDFDWSWGDMIWGLKEAADYYPFEAQCKLAEPMKIRPRKIIVTSNYTIREVCEDYFKNKNIKRDEEFIKALERRFTVKCLSPKASIPDVYPPSYFWDPIDVGLENPADDPFLLDPGLEFISYDKNY